MKRALKKKSSVYSYLDSIKVLETGTDEDIANAKKAYWRAYKAEWRRNQRKSTRQYTIEVTSNEAKEIASAAKKHKRSSTRYIKEAALFYIQRKYLVPDELALRAIRQLLAVNYNALQQLFDENLLPLHIGRTLLQQMSELEQRVLRELYHPKERKNESV